MKTQETKIKVLLGQHIEKITFRLFDRLLHKGWLEYDNKFKMFKFNRI